MLRKINSILLVIIMLANLILPAVYAGEEGNYLISVGTGNYKIVVKEDTTISQISQVLGEAKIITDSPYGGHCYSFYTDSNYSNYLYIETDEEEKIVSYGSVDPSYTTKTYSYNDAYNYRENGVLHGCLNNRNGKINGGIYYNKSNISYNEGLNKYKTNYEGDETRYLYSLTKQAVEMFNALRINEGYEEKLLFDDDCFYMNLQLKEFNTSIKQMLERADRSSEYRGIKLKENVGLNNSVYYIMNPLVFASLYSYSLGSDFSEKNIAIFDYDKDTKIITTGAVKSDVLDMITSVPYTNEEKQKLAAGRNLYKSAIEKLYREEGLYKIEPQSKIPSQLVAGELKDSKKQGIVDYVNMVRVAAGLSKFNLNEEAFEFSQYISTLISYRKTQLGLDITHIPPKPDGVTDEYYQKSLAVSKGYAENLGYAQRESSEAIMMHHINMFLDDGSERPQNFSHRTKILDSGFTEFGYGISELTFANEFSGTKGIEVDTQAWPAKGVTFLESLVSKQFKWTTQFERRYKIQDNTTVEVECINNGKRWSWTEEEGNVNTSRFFTRYTKSISSINNKVVFYDSSIVPNAGDVYKITLHNVLDENTNKVVDYSYRTVFENANEENSYKKITSLDIEAGEGIETSTNNTYTAMVGKDAKLNAKIGTTNTNECLKLIWTSSDESKVEVTQNGIITVKDVISNPVTIKVVDIYSGLEREVNIVTNTEKITMRLDKHNHQLNGENDTVKLNAMLSTGVISKATWTSSNPEMATVNSEGLVTAKKGGILKITASNDYGTDTCEIYVCALRTLPDGRKVYPGDLDGNGVFNSNDSAIISDLVNSSSLTPDEIAVADLNGDLIVNGIDTAISLDFEYADKYKPGKYTPITEIRISKTSLTLEKGNTQILSATYLPVETTDRPSLTWRSNNTKVATVANGIVTAVSAGTATITVSSSSGEARATCTVTVTEPALPEVAITGITLNKTVLSLEKGKREILTATITPSNTTQSKDITWSSDKTAVATVDSTGKITAVSVGTATITATTSNGKKATCTVTVTNPTTPVEPANPDPTPTAGMLGDTDGNSKITTKDAKMVLQHIVKKIVLTDEEFARADADKNSKITTKDAKMILQHIVKKIVLK